MSSRKCGSVYLQYQSIIIIYLRIDKERMFLSVRPVKDAGKPSEVQMAARSCAVVRDITSQRMKDRTTPAMLRRSYDKK